MRTGRKGRGVADRSAAHPNPATSIGVDRRACHPDVHHSAIRVPVHDDGLFALGGPRDLFEPRPASIECGFSLLDRARVPGTLGLVQIGFERLDR